MQQAFPDSEKEEEEVHRLTGRQQLLRNRQADAESIESVKAKTPTRKMRAQRRKSHLKKSRHSIDAGTPQSAAEQTHKRTLPHSE
ncbi:MAG: hypothetical protein DWI25_05310 [Planctomycetota bacterium]|nr:MAG: hypothetical protein DWI25_05310 [Planctomycetota bacterium]